MAAKKKTIKETMAEVDAASDAADKALSRKFILDNGSAPPLMVDDLVESMANTGTRRNKSATIRRTDAYKNISDSPIPFQQKTRSGSAGPSISIRATTDLVERAYFNFSVLKNVVDVMTEFSVSRLHLKGGTAKSRAFFENYLKNINSWGLMDQFFREFYRSGNVFIFRFNKKIQPTDIRKLSKTFKVKAANDLTVPVKYIILNPGDVEKEGTSNFSFGGYFKVFNGYELSRLQNPQTQEDRDLLEALPPSVMSKLKENKQSAEIHMPLDPTNVSAVFFKKQDYEPFGCPMAWPVLKELNAKEEMKQVDMALARMLQQAILVVTAGAKPDDGGVNKKHLQDLKTLFENQSVGKVLVADYTTKVDFVVPKVADILDPKKYEILDRDINIGLNNIFVGGEKFANQSAKVEVFVERLRHGREAFLHDFLKPEIKRISESLGFQSHPEPEFEEINLADKGIMAKVYTRLGEIGHLTPQETFKAIETGQLPEEEVSIENQKKFKDYKEDGLYEPLIGGGKKDDAAGRPGGTPGTPKSSSPVGPIGGHLETFSTKDIGRIFSQYSSLESSVEKEYKKTNKIRKASQADTFIIEQLAKTIAMNETPEKWEDSISAYLEDPTDKNQEKIDKVMEVGAKHGLDFFLASMLVSSKELK
jgi:hypothetical protein